MQPIMTHVQVKMSISCDDLMNALANIQRRRLLVAVMERAPEDDGTIDISDSDRAAGILEEPESIDHFHISKLVNLGLIEWDWATSEIKKGPNFDEIKPLIELFTNHEDDLPEDCL